MAKTLIEDYDFMRIGFADSMKRFFRELYGDVFSEEDLWGPSHLRNKYHEPTGKTLRIMLQEFGDKGRQVDEDIWVRPVMRDAQKMIVSGKKSLGLRYTPQRGVEYYGGATTCKGVCISDCRYPNELGHIKRNGGFTIRVKREGAGLKGEAGQHLSELALDYIPDEAFDFVINNNASLREFRMAIKHAVEDALMAEKAAEG